MFTPAPPGMTVREISLHVNKNTVSHAVHTPTSLPMQWQESAKTQLDNVAAMTIREKIPIGKFHVGATEWSLHSKVILHFDEQWIYLLSIRSV